MFHVANLSGQNSHVLNPYHDISFRLVCACSMVCLIRLRGRTSKSKTRPMVIKNLASGLILRPQNGRDVSGQVMVHIITSRELGTVTQQPSGFRRLVKPFHGVFFKTALERLLKQVDHLVPVVRDLPSFVHADF